MPGPNGSRGKPRDWIPVAALLIAFAVQSIASMRLLSVTTDETSHLPSGYTYLRTGDLRLNPQHPPLMKMLCALPLLFIDPPLNLRHPAWRAEPPDEWRFGYDFLFGGDADRLMFWGRLPVVFLAIVLGFYVYLWAREVFGRPAAFAALTLFAFSPNMIAHSHLVTMDLGLSCFGFACLYHLWRFVRARRRRDLVFSSLALGFALATKFSAVIFVPVVFGLLGLSAFSTRGAEGAAATPARKRDGVQRRNERGGKPRRLAGAVLAMAVLLVIAAVVVAAAYGFPSDPLFYWKGIERVNADRNPEYAYYLMGEFKTGGWWYYLLVAFLIKTPVPTILLLILSLASIRRYPARCRTDEAFLVLPVVVFTAATCALSDNLGLRYLLPVYPFLFVFASRGVYRLAGHWAKRGAAAVLGLWYLGAAAFIHPDHLSYFNVLVGGPARGHLYLDDSNIDWGQGLKQLKRYLDREGIDRVRLLYGWNGSPEYYGIRFDPVSTNEWASRPAPGVYAVSTHLLVRGEYHARKLGTPTNWLTLYEPVDRVGYSFYIFRFE